MVDGAHGIDDAAAAINEIDFCIGKGQEHQGKNDDEHALQQIGEEGGFQSAGNGIDHHHNANDPNYSAFADVGKEFLRIQYPQFSQFSLFTIAQAGEISLFKLFQALGLLIFCFFLLGEMFRLFWQGGFDGLGHGGQADGDVGHHTCATDNRINSGHALGIVTLLKIIAHRHQAETAEPG